MKPPYNNANAGIRNPLEFQSARISTDSDFGRAILPPTIQALRLQYNPLAFGSNMLAIRILPLHMGPPQTLAQLGYDPAHLDVFERFTAIPHGAVVVGAPTGHGKTTTLKVLLETRIAAGASPDGTRRARNAMSVEDPPEYVIPGVAQIPAGMAATDAEGREASFTRAMNALLRSDPDDVLIGETRDRPTAGLLFEAIMSGHFCMTTLHVMTAFGIAPRLMDLGVERYKLADPAHLRLLVSQRLVKLLCPHCSIPIAACVAPDWTPLPNLPADLHPSWRVRPLHGLFARLGRRLNGRPPAETGIRLPGAGCPHCRGRGHRGRTVVAEVFETSPELIRLLIDDDHAGAERYRQDHGIPNMADHAFEKLLAGLIDPLTLESVVTGHLS